MPNTKPFLVAVFSSIFLFSGCSNIENETKRSSDFSTEAIEAFYSIEVKENNQVTYQANFAHDGSSLELEGGDEIFVAIGSESLSLIESISFGVASYRLNRTEEFEAGRYFFEFTRESQENADNSFVIVPEEFTLVTPLLVDSDYEPSDGQTFAISWDAQGGVSADEEFTLRYDFDCRNDSGTPSISSSYVEKVEDDGAHTVDLAVVLGAGDYDQCSRFTIIAIRSNSDGNLDSALKSGSTVGAQVRTIEGSLEALQLL